MLQLSGGRVAALAARSAFLIPAELSPSPPAAQPPAQLLSQPLPLSFPLHCTPAPTPTPPPASSCRRRPRARLAAVHVICDRGHCRSALHQLYRNFRRGTASCSAAGRGTHTRRAQARNAAGVMRRVSYRLSCECARDRAGECACDCCACECECNPLGPGSLGSSGTNAEARPSSCCSSTRVSS